MKRLCILIFFVAAAMPSVAGFTEDALLDIWSVDPLVKVFRDAVFVPDTRADVHAARGETATFQLVIRPRGPLDALTIGVSSFVRETGASMATPVKIRFVGYVNVDRPMQKPCGDQLRQPPADYPDVLLERETIAFGAAGAQPVWITLPVPAGATPGLYTAAARITARSRTAESITEFPLTLTVYPVTVDKSRLWVTNWFAMHWPHMNIHPEPESEEYYALLRRYARNMAEHRQNVALISPLALTEFGVNDAGELTFDFSRFDRWVRLFQEEGVIGRIEGGHIGGRMGDWLSAFGASVRVVREGAVVSEQAAPDSETAKTFYSHFFPALVAHLKEQGWLECYLQHLADEPIAQNLESYRALAALARDYAPELKIVEANHSKDLTGAIDVWVPQLNYLHEAHAYYRERQAAGDEVWFYTCVFPQGEYANRFIEQPLIKTRLLHWINFAYGVTGYLHWGYNHWTADSPVTHTTRPHGGPPYLPAGDPWVVYPGADGPLDSIRFEAMRDGIADHELLSRLAEKYPEAAQKAVSRHVLDFDKYDTDVERFRATRIALLQALSRQGE